LLKGGFYERERTGEKHKRWRAMRPDDGTEYTVAWCTDGHRIVLGRGGALKQ